MALYLYLQFGSRKNDYYARAVFRFRDGRGGGGEGVGGEGS